MKKMLLVVWTLICVSQLASCRHHDKEDKKAVEKLPEGLPIPNRGPTLKEAVPVDGFTVKDLVSTHCSVTLLESNDELLIGSVESIATQEGDKITFSVYFPRNERGFVEKGSYSLKDINSSTCDISQLAKVPAVNITLAPINVYADPTLNGEVVCTFPAGSTLVSDSNYDPLSSGALPFFMPSNFDCKGLTRGYLYEWPVIISVHPKT
jgi:hypothetical protein